MEIILVNFLTDYLFCVKCDIINQGITTGLGEGYEYQYFQKNISALFDHRILQLDRAKLLLGNISIPSAHSGYANA